MIDSASTWRTFPRTTVRTGQQLFRITLRRNPDGTPRSAWYFSSSGNAFSGRFDLPVPRGTCYLSDAAVGSFLEVIRRLRILARRDFDARQLVVATRTGSPLPVGNLISARAARFGVTLDQAGGDDYHVTQELARRLDTVGLLGAVAPTRHDPALKTRTVALFGRAGARRARRGWTTRRADLARDRTLLSAIHDYGYRVLDIPFDLPTTPAP